jgi:hypothetical protein
MNKQYRNGLASALGAGERRLKEGDNVCRIDLCK